MYPEQCGVISAHHTRINGKIPDFTIAREGGVTEYVEFTMATVLACTHDAKPIPVARNREHANTHESVGIKISEVRKTLEYPRDAAPQQDHHHRHRVHWALQ